MRYIKLFAIFALVFALALCAVSCTGGKEPELTDDTAYYTVKFSSVGGTKVDDLVVREGDYIIEPPIPEKAGYIFDGWKTAEGKWRFNIDKVTTNVTLNAVWIAEKTVFEYEVNDEKVTITKYIGEIDDLEIPKTLGGFPVVAIADRAFYETSVDHTKSITIGEHILSVGEAAFYNCIDISINVEAKLGSIGEQSFYGCNGLKAITIGKGVEVVPFEAFSGCTSLKSVILSDTVKSISENAFELCSSLQTLTAHSSLETVEDSAFDGCEALVALYYYGDDESWAKTEIAEGNNGNDKLIGARVYFYSETEPADNSGKYWHYDDNGKVRIW